MKNQGNSARERFNRENSGISLLPKRRDVFVAMVASVISGSIGYLLNNNHPPSDSSTPERKIRDTQFIELLSRHGQIVYNEGAEQPDRTFIYLKQFHGGVEFIQRCQQDIRLAEAFVHHHRSLFRCLESLLAQHPKHVRFFFEGYHGTVDKWDADERTSGELLYRRTQENFEKEDDRSLALLLKIMAQSSRNSAAVLATFRAQERFTGLCLSQNLGYLIIGTATEESDAHAKEAEERVLAGMRGESLQQSEREYARRTAEGTNRSLDHTVHLMNREVPSGHMGVIVLGAAHSNRGSGSEVMQKVRKKFGTALAEGPPLEERLVKLPNTRTLVVDPAGLHALDVMRLPRQNLLSKQAD